MFKLHRGRARIDYYPKKASTVIDVGDALMFDDDGKVTTHDGGKKKIIGIAMKNVRSTDSDYASNTKIPVQIGASEDAEFLFETTGLATTDVGQSIGVSTSDPGLASVSGLPTMVVKEYLSATLGSAALIDPIDAFGGDSSQSNNVVTVTIGGNGDYNVESTATDAEVQINAAITAVNAAGGGVVQLGAGTFYISEPIRLRSNINLIGSGRGVTTVKAKSGFSPSTLNAQSGFSILANYYVSSATEYVSIDNVKVESITWDANAQNWTTPATVTNARHRAVCITKATNFKFLDCEVKNPWNWCIDIREGDHIWIQRCWIYAGWDSYDSNKYVNGKQDGIDVRGEYIWITDNYVDTAGIQAVSSESSGDDAIVVRGDSTVTYYHSQRCRYIWIERNVVKSGNRGIVALVDDQDVDSIYIRENTLLETWNHAIYFHRRGDGGETAKFSNSYIESNIVVNAGLNGVGDGVCVENDHGSGLFYSGLTVDDNTVITTTRRGFNIIAYGDNLTFTKNKTRTIGAGQRSVSIGDGTYPITNVVIGHNNIQRTQVSGSNPGMVLYGVSYGTVEANTIQCPSGSPGQHGMRIAANASVNALHLTVEGNYIENFANGIIEEANAAVNPDNNNISNNDIYNCTTPLTIVGTSTFARNNGGVNPERVYNQGNVTGATTFDRVNGDLIRATATGNITTTITNGKVAGDKLTLMITNGAGGAYTFSQPANVKLVGAAFAPTATNGRHDSWTLRWTGTIWLEESRALNQS